MRGIILAAMVALTSHEVAAEGLPTGDPVVPLPDEMVSADVLEQFRRCRSAVFFERSATEKSPIPEDVVDMMNDQLGFIMANTFFHMPTISYKDGERRLQYIEDWTFAFSRTVTEGRSDLAEDPALRGALLLRCQPYIWAVVRDHVDHLIRWRAKAMGLDNAPALTRRDLE